MDRDLIEHWLFAYHNLRNMPTIMNMYNGVFHSYMNQIKHPDVYIILDVNWQEFEDQLELSIPIWNEQKPRYVQINFKAEKFDHVTIAERNGFIYDASYYNPGKEIRMRYVPPN